VAWQMCQQQVLACAAHLLVQTLEHRDATAVEMLHPLQIENHPVGADQSLFGHALDRLLRAELNRPLQFDDCDAFPILHQRF
jgi:hypothetical protein